MALIVFDLISTLIDSAPRYVEAYIRTCEDFGHSKIPERPTLTKMLGDKNLKEIVSTYSPEVQDHQLPDFMQSCNIMCDRLLTESDWSDKLYSDTVETLRSLKNAGHEMGVFTGTREDAMTAQIYYSNLTSFFNARLMEGKNNEREGILDSVALKTSQLRRIRSNFQRMGGNVDQIFCNWRFSGRLSCL